MYSLPEETINAVLNYLASKPFQEVNQLIAAVQEATKVEEATDD